MAEYLINLTASGKASVAPFVDLGRTDTSPVALGDGFSINYITGFTPEFETNSITDYTTSGDALWVNQANVRTSGHRPPSGGSQILISGDPGASITVDIYSNGFSGRIVEWNLNGGAFVAQETNTLTETITLTGALDENGEAVLTFQEAAGSSGGPYSNALRITTSAGPALQITGDLTPSGSFTINYTGFTGVPVSPATFTDSAGNSITVAVTVSDNGDGTGSASGTMPALPSSGSVSGLKFGTVTASLSTA